MRPDDLPVEWLDRTSIVHLTDHGDISRLEFAQPPYPDRMILDRGENTAVGHDRLNPLNDDWRTRPMLDVTEEIGLILDDLAEHPSQRQQAADHLIELYNRHVDHHQRRVRCDEVLVARDTPDGPERVVGYLVNNVPFDIDGSPCSWSIGIGGARRVTVGPQ